MLKKIGLDRPRLRAAARVSAGLSLVGAVAGLLVLGSPAAQAGPSEAPEVIRTLRPRATESEGVPRRAPGDGPGDLLAKTVQVGGAVRNYLVYEPTTYSPTTPAPVVFVLHGTGMNGEQMVSITRFDRLAEQGKFLVVYPTSPNNWSNSDLGFVQALLDALADDYNVDARRVYVTGLSAGGVMAYQIACELADRVAAIGVVAATDRSEACAPARPISVLHIHGTDDPAFPYDGLTVAGREVFRAIPKVIADWRAEDGCVGQPQVTVTTEGGTQVTKSRSATCSQGTEVTLYTIEGAAHTWFGAAPGGANAALDATSTLWQSLQNYALPGLQPPATRRPIRTPRFELPTRTPTPIRTSTPTRTPTSGPSASTDLAVTVATASNVATVGSPVTFTVTVANQGLRTATDVGLTNILPAGAGFVSATPSQGDCGRLLETVTCDLRGLARNDRATVSIVVIPNEPGSIANTASVVSDQADQNSANNRASAVTIASR